MKVSVALCSYNGAKYIEQQLNSILHQTVSVDEIIICDDGSTDNTVEIAERVLKDSSVSFKIESNCKSLGVSRNFLKALKLTQGDYVFTCDQDDIWHKNKVKIFLDRAEQTKNDLYFSDGELVDSDGKTLGCTLWNAYFINITEISAKPYICTIIKKPIVTGAAMMVSRQLIDLVDEIPEHFLHDEWLSVVASINNSIEAINMPTFCYRQHSTNVVGAKKRSFTERLNIWLANYKRLEQIHNVYATKVSRILQFSQNSEYQPFVQSADMFWQDIVNVCKIKKIKRVQIMLKHFIKGDYAQFYTGIRGFLRDFIYFVFLYR